MEQLSLRLILTCLWQARLETVAWLAAVLSQLATSGLVENAKTQGWISFFASALVLAVVHGNKIKANMDAKAVETSKQD